MSAHKTLSKTERRRRSTDIYVIILYIGFYTFFLPFIYYYFSCRPFSRPLHARTWKNYYMRDTSRGRTIMILLLLLLCDGATRRLYTRIIIIIIYVPSSRRILYVGDVLVEEHVITTGGRPTGVRWSAAVHIIITIIT